MRHPALQTKTLATVIATLLGTLPLTAFAQGGSTAIEEIIVTAQFSAQSLQQTPIAITAMNDAMLEARSLTDITQVAASAPNVTLASSSAAFGNATTASIRGVGQYDSSFAVEPGVGMYIDDVYHGTLLGSVFDLLDLERVEILRGPQGTLAGKNSIGGAVKLYSKKPEGSGGGYVEGVYGEFNRVDLRAAGQFTLIEDQLFARLSGSSKQRDGHITRYDFGCVTGQPSAVSSVSSSSCRIGEEGGQDVHAMRAAIRWLPSDAVEVNFAADTTVDRSEPGGTVLAAVYAVPDPTGTSALPSTATRAQYQPGSIYKTYSNYSNPSTGYHAQPKNEATASGVSATVDWEITDALMMKSITAWREVDSSHVQDDGMPLEIQLVGYSATNRQISQEFRLTGLALNERLDWTVGAYYYEADGHQGGRKSLPTAFPVVVNHPVFGTQVVGDFIDDDIITSESRSIFAHGVWEITDNMNLVTGIRYTEEEKNYEFGRLDTNGQVHNPILGVGGLHGLNSEYSGEEMDYRVGIDYRWTDTLMTYAQYSTGFKGGGINSRPYFPFQALAFAPETLEAFEVGLKSDLFDRSVRLNLSAFINEYDDIQLTALSCNYLNPPELGGPSANLPCALMTNAGSADVKGVEAEIEWHPIDGLIIDISGSWLDFKYSEIADSVPVTKADLSPFTPEKQASLGIQYAIRMGNGASLTPRFDVSYRSEFYTNAVNLDTNRIDGLTMMNARLTWESPTGDWQTALIVTNLADKEYFANVLDVETFGTAIGQPGRPREWAVSIKRNF